MRFLDFLSEDTALPPEADDDTSWQPTYADTAEVKADVFPLLQEKIAKLNKKATTLGVPQIELDVKREFLKEAPSRTPSKIKRHEKWYEISIKGETPKIAGWTFLATIEHKDGGNVIRAVPGHDDDKRIAAYYNANPDQCDHCNKVRRRNDTYIVESDKGELKQVGRMCMRDFLGGKDPKAILWYFAMIESVQRLANTTHVDHTTRGRRVQYHVTVEDVLAGAAAIIREHGYVSSKMAEDRGGESTPSLLRWAMFGMNPDEDYNKSHRDQELYDLAHNPTDDDRAVAEEALDWFRTLPLPQKQSNTFMQNLSNIIDHPHGITSRDVGYAVALFPVYHKAMREEHETSEAAPQAQKSNQWVGSPGQKIAPTQVKILAARPITTDFGMTTLFTMQDAQGNQYKWFANRNPGINVGDDVLVSGKVKKHEDYKGTKYTMLSHVKAHK